MLTVTGFGRVLVLVSAGRRQLGLTWLTSEEVFACLAVWAARCSGTACFVILEGASLILSFSKCSSSFVDGYIDEGIVFMGLFPGRVRMKTPRKFSSSRFPRDSQLPGIIGVRSGAWGRKGERSYINLTLASGIK